jgi:hypothetical protein
LLIAPLFNPDDITPAVHRLVEIECWLIVCPVLVTNARMKIQLAHDDFRKMGYFPRIASAERVHRK